MKKAPEHLSAQSRALWSVLLRGNKAPSAAGMALLAVGLESLDRANSARVAIDRDGLVIAGAKLSHLHPLLKVEKDARVMFARIWAQLRLDSLG